MTAGLWLLIILAGVLVNGRAVYLSIREYQVIRRDKSINGLRDVMMVIARGYVSRDAMRLVIQLCFLLAGLTAIAPWPSYVRISTVQAALILGAVLTFGLALLDSYDRDTVRRMLRVAGRQHTDKGVHGDNTN